MIGANLRQVIVEITTEITTRTRSAMDQSPRRIRRISSVVQVGVFDMRLRAPQ